MRSTDTSRSFLFVPGDRPERFQKAVTSGADAVILDLEDAVAAESKAQARSAIVDFLGETNFENTLIRVNEVGCEFFRDDLEVARHAKLAGVVLPKAQVEPAELLTRALERPVLPLIETAVGVSAAYEIATIPGVRRLLLGTIDLSLELGFDLNHAGGKAMIDQARFALSCASAFAGLAKPVDGVFPALEDSLGLQRATEYAGACGMGGMMCIHPSQIPAVHQALSANKEELDWAAAVLSAAKSEKSSFRFRGHMIDGPILERARRVLAANPA